MADVDAANDSNASVRDWHCDPETPTYAGTGGRSRRKVESMRPGDRLIASRTDEKDRREPSRATDPDIAREIVRALELLREIGRPDVSHRLQRRDSNRCKRRESSTCRIADEELHTLTSASHVVQVKVVRIDRRSTSHLRQAERGTRLRQDR